MGTKRILISGCSSGIGFATAKRLKESGHTVYATARNTDSLSELVAMGCVPVQLDVCNESSMESAVTKVLADGSIDVLVNNAGYGLHGPLEEISIDDVRTQFETNVFGLLRLTQLVLPSMRAQHSGLIVNISSMAGRIAYPGGGAYYASKHAVEALTDTLRYEVSGFGINVVAIEPGVIQTRWGSTATQTLHTQPGSPYVDFVAGFAKSYAKRYNGKVHFGEGTADDVAQTVERAINAKRPRTRYKVTLAAKVLIPIRRLIPDRTWDRVMRFAFPKPPKA